MTNLDDIMSGRSDAAPEQAATPDVREQPAEGGQNRDDQGRFAPKAPEPQQPAIEQPETQAPVTPEQRAPEGYIPIQALDARLGKVTERYEQQLREQAEHFQRMLVQAQRPQQPQEKPKQPDWYENPDAAVDYRLQQAIEPVQQNQQQIVEGFSRMMAADKFGEEAVNAAYTEMSKRMQSNAPGARFDFQRIMASPHPYGELVKWHKAQTALSTYGDDPNAYREKLRAEILAEVQASQQPQSPSVLQSPQPPQQQLPQSFADARNNGPRAAPQWGGPKPLSEIMPGNF